MKKYIIGYAIALFAILYSMITTTMLIMDHPDYYLFLLIACITQIIAGFSAMHHFTNKIQIIKKDEEK